MVRSRVTTLLTAILMNIMYVHQTLLEQNIVRTLRVMAMMSLVNESLILSDYRERECNTTETECANLNDLTDWRTCQLHELDCWQDWRSWSVCERGDEECGTGGRQTRTRFTNCSAVPELADTCKNK